MVDDFVSISPINFFQLSLECFRLSPQKKKTEAFLLNEKSYEEYVLPSTQELTSDDTFAEVALGWSPEGLEAYVKVDGSFTRASYPQVDQGDSVELFIDTRDVKTSGYNTRFCHHFFFFPEALEGRQAGEITRFRSEDAHDLCDPKELKIKSSVKKNSYTLQIFIPAACLHGYDPEQYDKMGFTYRINRSGYTSQHFSVITDEFQLEQQPSLWSSLRLVK